MIVDRDEAPIGWLGSFLAYCYKKARFWPFPSSLHIFFISKTKRSRTRKRALFFSLKLREAPTLLLFHPFSQPLPPFFKCFDAALIIFWVFLRWCSRLLLQTFIVKSSYLVSEKKVSSLVLIFYFEIFFSLFDSIFFFVYACFRLSVCLRPSCRAITLWQ